MSKYYWLLLLILPMLASANPWQATFTDKAHFSVCFTPGGHCTDMIVEAIHHAHKSIEVQSYSFTSLPIVHALISAKKRGIKIDVLLDKSNVKEKYSVLPDLEYNNIPFLIDYQPSIAHNKIMIIDNCKVITGSFNFTKSAQVRNSENVLIITSAILAKYYRQNFYQRKQASISLSLYQMQFARKHYRRHNHNKIQYLMRR